MYQKRFYVRIDLQLHAITCPGVWLCTHGYLEATIKTLGYYFRTGAMEPRFPLLCHDEFSIEGYFKSVGSMEDLERVLAAERVELTLWQHGRRLAYFVGQLGEIMQTSVPKLTCAHNINVQVLLKPTTAFPGIIAPKMELSATVGVQDRLARAHNTGSSSSGSSSQCTKHCHGAAHFVTPNFELAASKRTANRRCQQATLGGSCFNYLEDKRRQRPVCHGRATRYNSAGGKTDGATLRPSVSSPSFTGDAVTHTSGARRLSTCSSNLSGNSYTFGQAPSYSSGCSHSTSNLGTGTSLADEHQRGCIICQSYMQTFM